jgi:FkbM family methyltransferase
MNRKVKTVCTLDGVFEFFLNNRLAATSTPVVVQVGANDGMTNDPIYKHLNNNENVKAVFVEPQPDAFQKLISNYKKFYDRNGHHFVNMALSDGGSSLMMYRIKLSMRDAFKSTYKENSNPSGITSTNRAHIENFLEKINAENSNGWSNWIEEFSVPSVSFAELIKRLSVDKINLLQVDVEGGDYMIVKMVFDSGLRPDCINMEIKNLSDEHKRKTYDMLYHDYYIVRHGGDLLAIKKSLGIKPCYSLFFNVGRRLQNKCLSLLNKFTA